MSLRVCINTYTYTEIESFVSSVMTYLKQQLFNKSAHFYPVPQAGEISGSGRHELHGNVYVGDFLAGML